MGFGFGFKDAGSAGKNVEVHVFLIEDSVFKILVILNRVSEVCFFLIVNSVIQLVLLIKDRAHFFLQPDYLAFMLHESAFEVAETLDTCFLFICDFYAGLSRAQFNGLGLLKLRVEGILNLFNAATKPLLFLLVGSDVLLAEESPSIIMMMCWPGQI